MPASTARAPALDAAPAALDPTKAYVVGGAVLKLDPDGRPTQPSAVLLVRRSPHESLANFWEMPGGGVESTDASLRHALSRELREETGLVVKDVVRRLVDTGWRDGKTNVDVVKLSFVVSVEQQETVVLNPKEHTEYSWVTASEQGNLRMTPQMRMAVADALGDEERGERDERGGRNKPRDGAL